MERNSQRQQQDFQDTAHRNYLADLRKRAKRCLNCNVPMIGTSVTSRQKYCSPECSKDYKAKIQRSNRDALNS